MQHARLLRPRSVLCPIQLLRAGLLLCPRVLLHSGGLLHANRLLQPDASEGRVRPR